ncbi:hypothetical protein V5O48_007320 [Marasmius crinis-equi]|uniref:Uncharacterized protein n=1 Tax=Marasmius crinis-equi TaxID=585013 RepID=A0ABR3FH42_9AGAR
MSTTWNEWSFNLQTDSWQYDLPSVSILKTHKNTSDGVIGYWSTPFPHDTHPEELEPHSIVAHFEQCLGDFMYTCSILGGMRIIKQLFDFTNHELLTFGTVINRKNPAAGILGHFPFIPPPTWELPYLFVPPIPVETINNMPCVRWNATTALLFYWCSDPEGKERIPEADWEKHGIPKLQVETWIGVSWPDYPYKAVQEYLRLKNYGLDGKQYALERGWPLISQWDPHNPDTGDWEQPDEDEVAGCFGFTSRSTCSLIEIPNEAAQSSTEIDGPKSAGVGTVARWVKGLLKRDGMCSK